MFVQSHTRFAFALATLGLAVPAIAGCASSAVPAQAPNALDQGRCSGFTEDRAVADILSGNSVESVTPLYFSSNNNKANVAQLLGAVLIVRPAPGETAEWLDRALECHRAKALAMPELAAGATGDPFVSPSSTTQIAVRSAGDGFRIEVSNTSNPEAQAILAHAQALLTAPKGGADRQASREAQ